MQDEFVRVSRDDEQARRVAGLILAFSNARRALSNDELRDTYYPQSGPDAFRKAFQRDRATMAACGLTLVNVAGDGQVGLWKVDEGASFPDEGGISSKDALVLDVACAPLVRDPSFPHRSELRMALAKIDGSFGPGGILEQVFSGGGGNDENLPALLGALSKRKEVRVVYQSKGRHPRKRVLRLYGSFGLRAHSYFVGSELGEEGRWKEPRVYRLDRFLSARVVAGTNYRIPPDFRTCDYLRLPFQIGHERGTATLLQMRGTDDGTTSELSRHGRRIDGPKGRSWEIDYSDLVACARWCVAHQVRPSAPKELVTTWNRVVEEASHA